MKNCELVEYLESEFNKKVKFIPLYDKESFNMRMELRVDGENIGKFGNPEEMYQDILYMFGNGSHDNFYQDIIEPIQFSLPPEFENIEDFATNEIKTLFREVIQQHYE